MTAANTGMFSCFSLFKYRMEGAGLGVGIRW